MLLHQHWKLPKEFRSFVHVYMNTEIYVYDISPVASIPIKILSGTPKGGRNNSEAPIFQMIMSVMFLRTTIRVLSFY